MDVVDIGAGLRSSRLGFGCTSLSLADPASHHDALLGTVWDAGVRWFDVARSYSYGAAEQSLGTFLRGRRDEAVVVTKFGISPPRGAAASPLLRDLARRALSVAPGVKRRLTSRADRATAGGRFSPGAAASSLDASLAALRTDRVDVLLMHEVTPGALEDDLHDWLQAEVQRGRVLRWGTATTSVAVTAQVVQAHPWAAAPVVQVEDALSSSPDPATVLGGPDRLLVTHSLLKHAVPRLRERLNAEPALAHALGELVGGDVRESPLVGPLLLSAAVARRASGVALFSSRDLTRCAASAAALDTFTPERARELLALLGAEAPSSG